MHLPMGSQCSFNIVSSFQPVSHRDMSWDDRWGHWRDYCKKNSERWWYYKTHLPGKQNYWRRQEPRWIRWVTSLASRLIWTTLMCMLCQWWWHYHITLFFTSPPQTKKEAARGEEKSTRLKRDLQDAKDKIVRLENRIREMVCAYHKCHVLWMKIANLIKARFNHLKLSYWALSSSYYKMYTT